MRLRNVPGARETIIENQFSIQQPEQMKGKWAEVFKNDHPIHIEVGMGKGQFIIEMARRNPEVNYIGIEKYSSVLVRAVEKLEDFEQDNLRLIRMDAENIEEVFDKDEVDRIYLNFSDPWPKDRHAKRRLTSTRFLERYQVFRLLQFLHILQLIVLPPVPSSYKVRTMLQTYLLILAHHFLILLLQNYHL